MTDSTTRLREALSQIAADHTDDAPEPATLDAIWRTGSRRRWRARAGVVATLGVVALLVLGAFFPWGVPTAAVPATPPGVPLARYPEHVAMPWGPHVTSTPGLTALVLPGTQDSRVGVHAVAPDGSVSFVSPDDVTAGFPPSVIPGPALAVSPDGRWLATASALLDLISGDRVGITPDRSGEAAQGTGAVPSWSPDSSRVLYPTVPSLVGAEAVVVDLAGGVQDVPPAGVGDALLLAGWIDEDTVVGLWRRSADEFTVLTWSLGDDRWTNGATVPWPGWEEGPQAAASVSPDGSRLLLLRSVDSIEAGTNPGTQAQVFDTSTGAVVGFPVGDVPASDAGWTEGSFLSWEGNGCRPAWRGDVPVITDGGVRLADGPGGEELVSISSAFGTDVCPAFAGNELSGEPVPNLGAVWLERLHTWGIPLGALVLAGFVVWLFGRRQNWREHSKPLPAIFPTFGR